MRGLVRSVPQVLCMTYSFIPLVDQLVVRVRAQDAAVSFDRACTDGLWQAVVGIAILLLVAGVQYHLLEASAGIFWRLVPRGLARLGGDRRIVLNCCTSQSFYPTTP